MNITVIEHNDMQILLLTKLYLYRYRSYRALKATGANECECGQLVDEILRRPRDTRRTNGVIKVVSVLRERLSVPESKLSSEHWDEPLTGRFFGFSGVDLIFELERVFNARFGERDLAD